MKKHKGQAAELLTMVIGLILFLGLFWFFPMYGKWCNTLDVQTAKLKGEAQLMKANQNRQIRITEAKAKLEATKYERETIVIKARAYGDAERAKAKGVADANRIISNSLNSKVLQNNYIKALPNIKGNLFFTNGNSMPAVVLK